MAEITEMENLNHLRFGCNNWKVRYLCCRVAKYKLAIMLKIGMIVQVLSNVEVICKIFGTF